MAKNELVPEAEALSNERPPKRQKLAPPSSTSHHPDSLNSTTKTSSSPSSINIADSAIKMEEAKVDDAPINQMITINTDDRERECEVGIVHYVNLEQKGFSGILKQRYTDFLVNEIALDGTIRHLKDDRAPNFAAAAKAKERTAAKHNNSHDAKPEPFETKANGDPNAGSAMPTATEVLNEPTIKQEPIDTTEVKIETEAGSTQLPVTSDQAQSAATEELVDAVSKPVKVEEVDTQPPTDPKTEATINIPTAPFCISPEDEALLIHYFDDVFKDEILHLHRKIISKPNAKHNTFGSILSPPFTNRAARGTMHGDMRRIFSSCFETETIDDRVKVSAAPRGNNSWHGREGTVVQQQTNNSRGQRVNQAKGKLGWQELGGEYLHFNLFKENKDTMEVTSYLARILHIKPKDFAFAGTKDRRAVTVQRVSIFRQHAKDLARQNNMLRQARLGDFKYEKFPLKLGELNGNLFTIALRDCHFDGEDGLDQDGKTELAKSVLTKAVEKFEAQGFLNYFGLQRFGTFGIGTHDVGKLILNNDFEGAVKSILTYNHDLLNNDPESQDRVGRDDIARARAISLFESTGNFREPLEELPKKFAAEAVLIRHLGSKHSRRDFFGALSNIHRNLKTMYVHAYQSLVWNTVASERWSRFGAKVTKGDLVMIVGGGEAKAAEVKDEVDQNGEIVVHPAVDDTVMHLDDMFERARPLTAEEAGSGKYTIFDIVLPTPGFDVEYPANEIGDYYKEFMASERGGGLDPSNMRRSHKDFSLSGNYRKLLSQAKELGFEVKWYQGDTEQLAETDLEILEKSRPKPKEVDQSQQRNGQNDWYNQTGNNNGRGARGGRGGRGDRGGRGGRGGRGSFFDNNNRGNRGGYGQNPRGRYNDNGHNGSNRAYRDIRLDDPEEARKLLGPNVAVEKYNSVGEAKQAAYTASLNAWNSLPARLMAEEAAAVQAAQARREAEPVMDISNIKLPEIQETFIQTVLDDSGRRIVSSKKTMTLDENAESAEAIKADLKSDQLSKPVSIAIEVTTDLEMKDDATPVELSEPTAITSDMANETIASAPRPASPTTTDSAPTTTDSDGGVLLEPKLAVIVKFALGPSQYATMALRELMKAGGVKTYKPDYSSGR